MRVLQRLNNSIISNRSFFFMVIASICYFSTVILARKLLEGEDLYVFNAMITLVSISSAFCFIGSEQLFLRFCNVTKEGVVQISDKIIIFMGINLIVYTIVLLAFGELIFFKLDTFFLYPAIAIFVAIFVFAYNFFRVRKHFLLAQIAANGWKIIGMVLVLGIPSTYFLEILLVGLGVSSLVVILMSFRSISALRIEVSPMPKSWDKLYFGFGLSLFIMMLLGNGDRLFIAHFGTQSEFSDYVYLVTILVLPFSLLANYLGFKEMAHFKHSFYRSHFNYKMFVLAIIVCIVFAIWFLCIYLAQDFLNFRLSLAYFFPCLLIVEAKCLYSLASALFGLKGKPNDISFANIYTLFFFLACLLYFISIDFSLVRVLFLLSGLWSFRFCIVYLYTLKVPEYG